MIKTAKMLNLEYFEWLCSVINANRSLNHTSYDKLLNRLHSFEFRYLLEKDQGRAEAGENLRYRFATVNGLSRSWVMNELDGPCSVLEMMIALAIQCEETIMDDARIGNRTSQWFWGMVVNLGLGSMDDNRYDEKLVDQVINRFLDREYEPNGKGGLFTVKHCYEDLRDVEIWYQLCWYLDDIT